MPTWCRCSRKHFPPFLFRRSQRVAFKSSISKLLPHPYHHWCWSSLGGRKGSEWFLLWSRFNVKKLNISKFISCHVQQIFNSLQYLSVFLHPNSLYLPTSHSEINSKKGPLVGSSRFSSFSSPFYHWKTPWRTDTLQVRCVRCSPSNASRKRSWKVPRCARNHGAVEPSRFQEGSCWGAQKRCKCGDRILYHQTFQVPKMEVLRLIRLF